MALLLDPSDCLVVGTSVVVVFIFLPCRLQDMVGRCHFFTATGPSSSPRVSFWGLH